MIEAESGTEPLELAKQIPSAILLDVKLHDILGYEVCRRPEANPRTSRIPVLQLSAAFVNNKSSVYALESGADAYLTQPVEPYVLVATIRSVVKTTIRRPVHQTLLLEGVNPPTHAPGSAEKTAHQIAFRQLIFCGAELPRSESS